MKHSLAEWAELFKQVSEGKTLQVLHGSQWRDSSFNLTILNFNTLSNHQEYRIKPEPVKRLITWEELIKEGLPLLLRWRDADISIVISISKKNGINFGIGSVNYTTVEGLLGNNAEVLRSHDGGKTWKDFYVVE
jgi:hypothetical protein